MNRRDFLRTMGLGAATMTVPQSLSAAGESPSKPNIIFIMADGMGYGDVGRYNPKSKNPMPHLDQFRGEVSGGAR